MRPTIVSMQTEKNGNGENYLSTSDEEQAKKVVECISGCVKPISYFFMLFGIKLKLNFGKNSLCQALCFGVCCRAAIVATLLLAHLVSCARVIVHLVPYERVEVTFAEKLYTVIQICFFSLNLVTFVFFLVNGEALCALLSQFVMDIGKLIAGSQRQRQFLNHFRSRICAFLVILGVMVGWKINHVINVLGTDSSGLVEECRVAAPFLDIAVCYPMEVFFTFSSVSLFIFFLASLILLLVFLILLKINFEIIEETRYFLSESVILGNQLDQFLTCHRAACSRVRQLNDLFSCLIMIWIFCEIFDMIMSFGAITKAPTMQLIICYIVIVTLLAASFLTKFFLISSINLKVLTTLDCVYVDERFGGQLGYINGRSLFKEAKQYYHLYCTRLAINTPCISGCGFFKIDRRFLMTVACLVLSYSLLLQDIDQKQQFKG